MPVPLVTYRTVLIGAQWVAMLIVVWRPKSGQRCDHFDADYRPLQRQDDLAGWQALSTFAGGSLPPWDYVIASCEIVWQTLIIRKLIEDDGENPKKVAIEVLWPAPERALSETIPASLRDEHAEARACFRVNAYTVTVVMVR